MLKAESLSEDYIHSLLNRIKLNFRPHPMPADPYVNGDLRDSPENEKVS